MTADEVTKSVQPLLRVVRRDDNAGFNSSAQYLVQRSCHAVGGLAEGHHPRGPGERNCNLTRAQDPTLRFESGKHGLPEVNRCHRVEENAFGKLLALRVSRLCERNGWSPCVHSDC